MKNKHSFWKGKNLSKEHIENIRKGKLGTKHSELTKQKQRKFTTELWKNPEYRKACSIKPLHYKKRK